MLAGLETPLWLTNLWHGLLGSAWTSWLFGEVIDVPHGDLKARISMAAWLF